MGIINVLDKHTAELIAAGEVVERPSSVIKELAENSIDAHATAVTIEIQHGGITYMRLTDNGVGISREDVPKAFLRHATSKVKIERDLDAIGTLGFRGEALASICAVSKVELITKTKDELVGTHYFISGSDEESIDDIGCPVGTTVIARDLFYNVPARMKFLKKDVAEGNAVAGVVDKIALSHPEVAFTLIRDGKKVMSTPGDNKLISAICGVFGKDFASELIPVDYTLNGVRVKGYISKPVNARPTRGMQNFFLNGRFVKSKTAVAAIEEACKGSVMVGKFPGCVLHIEMDLSAVDVNVHPAKIEVRFTNERPVFDAVYHAVKSSLLEGDENREIKLNMPHVGLKPFSSPNLLKPEETEKNDIKHITVSDEQEDEPIVFMPNKIIKQEVNTPANDLKEKESFLNLSQEENQSKNTLNNSESYTLNDTCVAAYYNREAPPVIIPDEEADIFQITIPTEQAQLDKTESIIPKQEVIPDTKKGLVYVGEVFDTYIIVQNGDNELLLIDKHAAHERLIYEKLKKERETYAQLLLVPLSVVLSKEEYTAILENTDILYEAGYEAEDFGNSTILLRSVPQFIDGAQAHDSIIEIAGYLCQHKSTVTTEKTDWIFQSIACRSAVKAGDKSHIQELISLVEKIEKEGIRYCPHGRPITTVIKRRELEKSFGRIQ